jgi:hypothetical protein
MLKLKNVDSQTDFAEFAKSATALERGAVSNLPKLIEKMQNTNRRGTLVTTQTTSVEEAKKRMFEPGFPKPKFHKCKNAGYLYILVPESVTPILKVAKDTSIARTRAQKTPTSDEDIYHLFLQKMEDYDWQKLFTKPIDTTLSVKNPMGFEIIRRNIINSKYDSFEQFKNDVLLCFKNASEVGNETTHREANRLKKKFEELRIAYFTKSKISRGDRRSIFAEAIEDVKRASYQIDLASSPKPPEYVGINLEIIKIINAMLELTEHRFHSIPLGIHADHMDFETMLGKAKNKEYKQLKDFEVDFDLMFKNLVEYKNESDERSAFKNAAIKARSYGQDAIKKLKARAIAPRSTKPITQVCTSSLGKRTRESVSSQESKENVLEKVSAYQPSFLGALQENYYELVDVLADYDERKRRRANL